MTREGVRPTFTEPLLGIVFDLDGTLVLSDHDFAKMRREVIRVAERYGIAPGRLKPSDMIPHLMDQARQDLEEAQAPEGQIYRMETEVNRTIDAMELEALPQTVVRPGAGPLLRAFADRGYRLGILTRSSEHFCRSALVQTKLAEFFPYLRTRSSAGPAKPSPEALHMLLREMEVPAERAAFVGDHIIDAQCAVRAGVRFYAVLPEVRHATEQGPDTASSLAQQFRDAGATEVVADLPELGRRLGIPAVASVAH
jgi:phosphoglycolate phosphatase